MDLMRGSKLRDVRWFLFTGVTVGFLAAIPLIWYRRYYFQDDSENGAFGVWHHIGASLVQAELPILNPSVWSSGNYLAEGQWGTWNPVIMLIGLAAYLSANAVLFMTVLKIILLMVAGTGVYLLARSYAARPPLAYVAGFAITLNGFTMYFDAPSWVTGLLVWALLPYFWLALRRFTRQGGTPLWAFLAGYLIVTVGYIQGIFAIGFVLLGVGTDSLLRRHWPGAWRTVGIGAALILVAVTVFLPGALTGSVTNRAVSIVGNDGMMSVDLGGLFSSTIATGFPQVSSWWWTGPTATSPVVYIAWFLPVLLFVDWKRVATFRTDLRDLAIVFALSLFYVLLPTVIGPLRYPVRFMPYVALTSILLTVILLSRAPVPLPGRGRLAGAGILIGAAVYLSWAQLPPHILSLLISGVVAAAGLSGIWVLLRRPRTDASAPPWTAVAALIALTSVLLTGVQHYDTRSSPLSMNNVPADTSIPAKVLTGVTDDVIVVGDPLDYQKDPAAWRETLMANMWYLSPARVQNRYQLIGFAPYNATLCLQYLGGTCPELLDTLFEVRPETGLLLVDQLSIDNIQILKVSVEESAWRTPPAGWRVLRDTGLTVVWTRDQHVGPAGDVVWTDSGTVVKTLSQTDTTVTVRVEELPAEGGRIAFSRLAWPGYTVQNATLAAAPVDGFLLGVDIPKTSEGDIVTVTFAPPGWKLEVAAWLVAVGSIVLWTATSIVLGRRRRTRGLDSGS